MKRPNRFKTAIEINKGACNPLPITRVLHEACMEAFREGKDTNSILQDPAVQLILNQLIFLTHKFGEMDSIEYGKAYTACYEQAADVEVQS